MTTETIIAIAVVYAALAAVTFAGLWVDERNMDGMTLLATTTAALLWPLLAPFACLCRLLIVWRKGSRDA